MNIVIQLEGVAAHELIRNRSHVSRSHGGAMTSKRVCDGVISRPAAAIGAPRAANRQSNMPSLAGYVLRTNLSDVRAKGHIFQFSPIGGSVKNSPEETP